MSSQSLSAMAPQGASFLLYVEPHHLVGFKNQSAGTAIALVIVSTLRWINTLPKPSGGMCGCSKLDRASRFCSHRCGSNPAHMAHSKNASSQIAA